MKKKDHIKVTHHNKAFKGTMFALGGVGVATAVIVPTMYFTLADDQAAPKPLDVQLDEFQDTTHQLHDQSELVKDLQQQVESLQADRDEYQSMVDELQAKEDELIEQQKTASGDQSALQDQLESIQHTKQLYINMLTQSDQRLLSLQAQLDTEKQLETELRAQVAHLQAELQLQAIQISKDEEQLKGNEQHITQLESMVVDPNYIQQLYNHYYRVYYDPNVLQGESENQLIHTWYEHAALVNMGVQDFSMFSFASTYVIPEGIKTIPDFMFAGAQMMNVTGFHLPSTVTKIGDSAFAFSKMPNGFTLTPSVTYLGRSAFDFADLPATFSYSPTQFTDYLGAHALSGAWIGRQAPDTDGYRIKFVESGQSHFTFDDNQTIMLNLGSDIIPTPSTMYIRQSSDIPDGPNKQLSIHYTDLITGEYAFGPNGQLSNRSDSAIGNKLTTLGVTEFYIDNVNHHLVIKFAVQAAAQSFNDYVTPYIEISNLSESYLDSQGLGVHLQSSVGQTRPQHDKTDPYRMGQLAEQAQAFDGNTDGAEIDASPEVIAKWPANGIPLPHVHDASAYLSGPEVPFDPTSADGIYNIPPKH